MSMIQLNPMIPVITPKGKGYAFVLIDYSQEHDLLFVVAQQSGEIWTWLNKDIRFQENMSIGRDKPDFPKVN